MKRILFKIRQFPHLSETFVLAQIVTGIKADLDVRVLVSEILDFEESTHQEVLEKYKIEEKIILEDYKVPKNRLLRTIGAVFILLKQITKSKNIVNFLRHKKGFSLTWIYQYQFYSRFEEFEIFHVQYGTNVHPVDILKKIEFFKGRLIVSFHGHDAFFPINGFIPNNGYYEHLFRGDNLIVANTDYLADKIKGLECPDQNIRVIPVGIDTDFFKVNGKEMAPERVRFINVGRLDKVKGHKYAIEFIKMMKDRKKNVELKIIGDGAEKQNLISLIENNNLSGVVFLVVKKSQEEVKKYLAESDVYLFTAVPLKNGRRETQGLATLEAAASGLPVLAFDSGGIKYTVKDNETGFLCPEYDMECLLKKGMQLMDHNLRIKMGRNAIGFAQVNFSQDKIDRLWKQIYSENEK